MKVKAVAARTANGNGHRSKALVPAEGTLPQLAASAFRPSPRDWQYLSAIKEVISRGEPVNNATVGKALGVTREAVRQRRKRPGRDEWINSQINLATGHLLAKADYRAAMLAVRGSIEHYKEVNKRFGRYPSTGTGEAPVAGSALQQNAIVVRIHN